MTLTREQVVEAAFKLSPEDRGAVVQELMNQLDADMLAEADRRWEAIERGEMETVPFDSIKAEILARAGR